MLTSFALIFILGLLLGGIAEKLRLPRLSGYLVAGIVIGRYGLFDATTDLIAADLRKIALLIILTRAGLSLDIEDLKKIGRPAVLMCIIPATAEIIGFILAGPRFFAITRLEAALMGTVIAAVSPAVIVPRMIRLMEEGYGIDKSIPQLILAGASVDDVYVIVLFTACSAMMGGESVSAASFATIPISIFLGALAGYVAGICFSMLVKRVSLRDSYKVVLLLSISFLFVKLEEVSYVPVSGLLAVMAMAMALRRQYDEVAVRIGIRFNRLWAAAEIMLFVLVGATVDLTYVKKAGFAAVGILLLALVFRIGGVLLCLMKTELTSKERFFCVIAYSPKATVQAAIGAIPLANGYACGELILTVAVMSILFTAPVGAILIDQLYRHLLMPVKD